MGTARKMVHEIAADKRGNVHWWPGTETLETADEPKQPKRPHWFFRAALWTGVIMSNPETPKGWSFNPSTVTLSLVIASMIAAGSYYMGKQDALMQQVQFEARKALDEAAKAKERETYNAGSVDAMKGHGNSNTEKKK